MKKLYCILTVFGVALLLCSNIYASTIVLQPGPEGKDTWVYTDNPDRNTGTDEVLWTRNNYYGTIYSLVQFDLSALPTNQTITSAVLELYSKYYLNNPTVNAYKITSDWGEMTATWRNQPTIDPAVTINDSGLVANWLSWDITDFVNGWYTGTFDNYGVELRKVNGGTENIFYSSDYSVASLRPKLTITYEEQTVSVPEPATLLLLSISVLGIMGLLQKYRENF